MSVFPRALERGALASDLLLDALRSRCADDLQCAMIVGHVFGFQSSQRDVLCRLLGEDWHTAHEDIVGAIRKVGGVGCVQALGVAARWVPKYLEYDESRSLAVKAIRALGDIGGDEAVSLLRDLSKSTSDILRREARRELMRLG